MARPGCLTMETLLLDCPGFPMSIGMPLRLLQRKDKIYASICVSLCDTRISSASRVDRRCVE